MRRKGIRLRREMEMEKVEESVMRKCEVAEMGETGGSWRRERLSVKGDRGLLKGRRWCGV